jgi:hypothetical protein
VQPLLGVEKQWVLHNLNVCVCYLRYPACNADGPYRQPLPAPLYNIFFPHYLINGTIFEKKNVSEHKMCFSPQLLSEKFLILRRNVRDMIKNVYWSSRKVPLIVVRFQWDLIFLDRFPKNTQISTLIKICPVSAKLFPAFSNFANKPKNCSNYAGNIRRHCIISSRLDKASGICATPS